MRDALFYVRRDDDRTLQVKIQDALTQAIINKQLDAGTRVPSTRAMAHRLGVSRNTVTIAYQALVSDGFLKPKDRSGFYVDEEIAATFTSPQSLLGVIRSAHENKSDEPQDTPNTINWDKHIHTSSAAQTNIKKPINWKSYKYPFIYGQTDPSLFPISDWRECTRQSMGKRWLDSWMSDHFAQDDPMLTEQIRKRVLLRRGIYAQDNEILITVGAQNALYLLANLLTGKDTNVAMEDPGFPDARNIFNLHGANLHPIPVDNDGLVVDDRLDNKDIIFVTPSHQSPTTVTMPIERRRALLSAANENDALIIEDDYEFETNYVGAPCPALKSLDKSNRVIYVGSLSKSVMHGLRLGFIVAAPEIIDEARALRRLMLRHPPGNNQRTMAQFLNNGHHDRFIHRLHRVYSERWIEMRDALEEHFPKWGKMPSFGGSSVWITGPEGFDADALTEKAKESSILIEPGGVYFANRPKPCPHFRLGFSYIQTDQINDGIRLLGNAADSIFTSP